jgi:hypothetical protein
MLCGWQASRISVNLIEFGLEWHHDFNVAGEDDLSLTKPGMTLVVHLCSDFTDIVTLDLGEAAVATFDLKPMMVYVFPGYAFKHRTIRAGAQRKTQTRRQRKTRAKRYSIAIFRPFTEIESQLADAYIHAWFPSANDNYEGRTNQVLKLIDRRVCGARTRVKSAFEDKTKPPVDLTIYQPYSHMEPYVTVGNSSVHGKGLFASQNIPMGAVICWYSGTCTRNVDKHNKSEFILDVIWVDPKTRLKQTWYLDSFDNNNSAGRWGNDAHNTQYGNNAEFTNGPLLKHPLIEDKLYVFIRATRDIIRGEEIFIPYGDAYWERQDL